MPEPCPAAVRKPPVDANARIDPHRLPAFVRRIVASVAEEEKLIDALCLAVLEGRAEAKALAAQLAERRTLSAAPPQPPL